MKFVSFSIHGSTYIRPTSITDASGSPISLLANWETRPVNHSFAYNRQLYKALRGRRMLLEQLDFSLKEIQDHVDNGYISYCKGIIHKHDHSVCNRCGNCQNDAFGMFPCARCLRKCMYCRKCIMMGRISECTPLVIWSGPERPISEEKSISMKWNGTLSVGQARASKQVVKAIANKENLLVWAVCGAGKTEVLFEGLAKALKENKKICVACPRVDVIHELTPRLQRVFPRETIISLYGGSKDRHKNANFVVATTHQLIHYYRFFDVIVIDEVDAFPFSYDNMLAYVVNQARKEQASTILLTATPSEEVTQGMPSIKIPARYHKNPLPVPTFRWIGNWQKKLQKHQVANVLIIWLKERLAKGIPVFIFVPSIKVMRQVKHVLRNIDERIQSVHAEDQQRKEKVEQFREGKIPCLITTTILERGVTVANLHVAVYGAEENIFSCSALVQIAGRVGRSKDYPTGDIIFFHYGKSKAMVAARNQIVAMNKEGKRLGLLHEK